MKSAQVAQTMAVGPDGPIRYGWGGGQAIICLHGTSQSVGADESPLLNYAWESWPDYYLTLVSANDNWIPDKQVGIRYIGAAVIYPEMARR